MKGLSNNDMCQNNVNAHIYITYPYLTAVVSPGVKRLGAKLRGSPQQGPGAEPWSEYGKSPQKLKNMT